MSGPLILGALLLAAASPAKVRHVPDRGAKPKYEFEGNVARKVARDTNRNGKHDRWEHYDEKGRLTRVELDTDNDGKVDFRSVVDTKKNSRSTGWPRFQVMKIKGRYRFVPSRFFPINDYQVIPGRARKLVKGRWTGTFTYKTGTCLGASPLAGYEYGEVTVNYVNGLPVRVVVSGGMYNPTYRETTFKDGLPVRKVFGQSKDRIVRIRTYKKGVLVREELDIALDGKMDERVDYSPKTPPHRRDYVLRDGEWGGTYTKKDSHYQWEGRAIRLERHWREGVLVKEEHIEVKTGRLRRRTSHKKGQLVLEETDFDLDGTIDFRVRYGGRDVYYTADTQMLKDGKWTGDFVLTQKHARMTYRGGRLRRLEQCLGKNGKYASLIVFVSATENHSGRDGKLENWYYYSKGPSRRLVREKRDTDRDGKPDIEIDYDKLTIARISGRK